MSMRLSHLESRSCPGVYRHLRVDADMREAILTPTAKGPKLRKQPRLATEPTRRLGDGR